ncbi:MAG TPA: YihY/virulence factor BrkB family protein [Candidatus Sulfotelmatobacter sp.]|nr:YihY/virulence factor BrkB family protein [Candidatus Sulfotelmatobacter sp.]
MRAGKRIFRRTSEAIWRTVEGVPEKHTLQMAAALSYYFVISLFPALILLSAILAYMPGARPFDEVLSLMSGFVPKDSIELLRKVLSTVVTPNRGTLLSFGVLGTLWTASGGFAAAIEALDITYEVEEARPFWVTRPLAVGLTLLVGVLLLIALGVMIVGPQFGTWLAARTNLSWLLAEAWPYIHWTVAVLFTVLAVEALYFIAPNVKQRFWATLPGAVLAVGCWIGLSYALGFYFRSFAHFNKTYGTMGAVIALMVWLYWTSFFMLVGAELNCQLAKETAKGKIKQDEDGSGLTNLDLAA